MGVKRCFGVPDDLNAPVSQLTLFMKLTIYILDMAYQVGQMCNCNWQSLCININVCFRNILNILRLYKTILIEAPLF